MEMILEVVTESCYPSVLSTGSMRFIAFQKVRKNVVFPHQARKKGMVLGRGRTILRGLELEKERRHVKLVIVKKK